jgi:gluconate 2-dehydrogenase gamma chain
MDINKKITRRNFISLSLLGVGGMCLSSLSPFSSNIKSRWRFFTEEESVLLDALAEQIIPTDESMGGCDSGTTNFIDKQLMGPYKRFQETYRKGLKAIQDTCKSKFKKRYEELPWDDQTKFLELMEAGKMEGNKWEKGFDKEFFELIRNHTIQGFYGSPRHGGNKKNVSYKMLKLDYPVIIGQNRYKS